jgi:UDP-glucose 4-epimerase
VYGEPKTAPVNEESPPNPVNAYGDSKFVFERILGWYGEIHGLKYISLRYFNVAGASKHLGACHHPETNLIPVVIKAALGDIEYLPVLGNDYNTRDGTCIRDYISVLDIARAHILALYCLSEEPGNRVCNLGNGEGFSVMEVIETARKVTGAAIPVKICPRRQGDPAVLIADYRRAKEYFGWEPENSSLEDIIRSAWLWQKEHPQGYGDAR